MSSNTNKANEAHSSLPSDMATPIYSIKELGHLIARDKGLETGRYDVVIEFKLGSIQMLSEKEASNPGPVPAMAVGVGGIGLRPYSGKSDSVFTIDHVKKTRTRSSK